MGWGEGNIDIKKFMVIFAYQMALNDATMQKAYTGSKADIGNLSAASDHIKEYIQNIYDGKYPDFYVLAEQLRQDFQNHPDFTFGNIQKLINMTAKYMCLGTYDDPEKRKFFKCCHCPMDRIMIQRVTTRYKELMDDNPDDIDRDNFYFTINNKKSHAWSSVNWSNIDFNGTGINSIEVYKKYQAMVNVIAADMSKDGEILPLELDFIEWNQYRSKEKTIIPNQAEGIAAAKLKGVKFGRPSNDLPDNFDEIYNLWAVGQLSNREAADKLNMAVSTFRYRAEKYREEKKM